MVRLLEPEIEPEVEVEPVVAEGLRPKRFVPLIRP
jgi:hypothetical protein